MPSSFDIISLNWEIFSWSVSAILCTLLIVIVFSLGAECTAFLESLLLFTVRQFFRSKAVYLSVVKMRESFHKLLLGILLNAFDVRFKISVCIMYTWFTAVSFFSSCCHAVFSFCNTVLTHSPQHSAYLERSYTASTPMTPRGACLTPSLQQGWVTSPVIYQQPYQNFTPRGLYGNPPLCVPRQSEHPQPSPV